MQVNVRDNNIEQALRALKKKKKTNGVLRENKKIRNALVKQIKAAHIKSKSKKK